MFVLRSACSQINTTPPHPALSDTAQQSDTQQHQASRTLSTSHTNVYHTYVTVQRGQKWRPTSQAGLTSKRRLVHFVIVISRTQTLQKTAVQPIHHLPKQQEEQEQLQEQQLPHPHRGTGWWGTLLGWAVGFSVERSCFFLPVHLTGVY